MPNDLRYKPQRQNTLASTSYKALFSGKSLKLPSDSRQRAVPPPAGMSFHFSGGLPSVKKLRN